MLASEGKHESPVPVVLTLWGYTNHSSSTAQSAVSALIKFGLLKSQGESAECKVQLTDLALKILLDQRRIA